ncbi:hypothetical protein KEM52_002622 [Ascosphaera acerosa]|nr:hypothetical protein KEM52_002622 [Ascosphaera acerosa]
MNIPLADGEPLAHRVIRIVRGRGSHREPATAQSQPQPQPRSLSSHHPKDTAEAVNGGDECKQSSQEKDRYGHDGAATAGQRELPLAQGTSPGAGAPRTNAWGVTDHGEKGTAAAALAPAPVSSADSLAAKHVKLAGTRDRTHEPYMTAMAAATTTTATTAGTADAQESISAAEPTGHTAPILLRFCHDVKLVCCSSIINVLLVFVPVGIAFGAMTKALGDDSPVSPIVTFSINAIAIIPLAYLLSFATESVASKLGDTVGALLNVTFGNAVELIILPAGPDFYSSRLREQLLNQIGIVQASLLGSILANLLLILGMCFTFGGLRFQEQDAIDTEPLVPPPRPQILLVIYIIYLLFQLKSHRYIYQSTPQERIDEESQPGVLADILDSSSTSSSSRSSLGGSSDSDDDASFLRRKKLKRALRRHQHHHHFRNRKCSVTSHDTELSRLSQCTHGNSVSSRATKPRSADRFGRKSAHDQDGTASGDEADGEGERTSAAGRIDLRIPETAHKHDAGLQPSTTSTWSGRRRGHRRWKKRRILSKQDAEAEGSSARLRAQRQRYSPAMTTADGSSATRFDAGSEQRLLPYPLPFTATLTPGPAPAPAPPSNASEPQAAVPPPGVVRRAHSLPTITSAAQLRTPSPRQTLRVLLPNDRTRATVQLEKQGGEPAADDVHDVRQRLSRTSAVITLLVSTGLVAACAEFLVDTIDYMVEHTTVSQAFIGLIILPIVGNAAEHVTAVTVACKNKMDLAIAVSLGSSIQIALFVTPVVVLLGWCLDTDMSLYFTLFETVSLFVSTFIVNYLVMDGRTNYLEGALLISTYVIIAVAAFFYPECRDQSPASGPNFSYC